MTVPADEDRLGFFGPASVTWRVHTDPSFSVGGLRALLLQALHPVAMDGVARNSAAMVGIATLTMKASTPNMNCAVTTMASTHQRSRVSTMGGTIWCTIPAPGE